MYIYHREEIVFRFLLNQPQSDCIYHFPIDFKPNKIQLGVPNQSRNPNQFDANHKSISLGQENRCKLSINFENHATTCEIKPSLDRNYTISD